ncbi:phytoene/squalene synthase family protein [Candidatus Dojkabacteria bacterium]|uniref:Phytoene/squalene synthase family protein n=1 Tax=Candidatus Dojkabacteria bacterium TaxID=2099670 RepID=A0A955RII1_9BACT|nr:phytoene/squalene synthase family protein [Candidatus Dojkabacteria bacterium]
MYKAEVHDQIFKEGSTVFYYSTKFFPEWIRKEVAILYAFVRVADDFVDCVPQDREGFNQFKKEYYSAIKKGKSDNMVIDSFVELSKKRKFEPEWTDAFLDSMGEDLNKNKYNTYQETLKYIYGSAEVIGLYMAKIIGLPKKTYKYAARLGRAYQLINFIRDIQYDIELGRVYWPKEELSHFHLENLSEEYTKKNHQNFKHFMRFLVHRFKMNIEEAHLGLELMPKTLAVAIKTASDGYLWTADKIYKNPFIVYKKIVKPSKFRVLFWGIRNAILMK